MSDAEKKVPRGKALDWSDEDWDRMAFDDSPDVIESAKQAVARHDAEAARMANAEDPVDE